MQEENVLALLETGRVEAEKTEEARQARYKSEDAARVALRAREDELSAEGHAVREGKKAEMEAAIAARDMTPQAQIAAQADRIAKLEALVEGRGAEVAPVVAEPASVV